MLQEDTRTVVRLSRPTRVAIVASTYNSNYVDGLIEATLEAFESSQASGPSPEHNTLDAEIIRVPGAFEIPVVASELAHQTSDPFHAILCYGVVLQGATSHAEQIISAVSQSLVWIQIERRIPVINGVYHFESEDQAASRCLNPKSSRGAECGRTTLEMVEVMRELRNSASEADPRS